MSDTGHLESCHMSHVKWKALTGRVGQITSKRLTYPYYLPNLPNIIIKTRASSYSVTQLGSCNTLLSPPEYCKYRWNKSCGRFLVARTRLYTPFCRSVRRSVRRSLLARSTRLLEIGLVCFVVFLTMFCSICWASNFHAPLLLDYSRFGAKSLKRGNLDSSMPDFGNTRVIIVKNHQKKIESESFFDFLSRVE